MVSRVVPVAVMAAVEAPGMSNQVVPPSADPCTFTVIDGDVPVTVPMFKRMDAPRAL